jgi:hypothetical protein
MQRQIISWLCGAALIMAAWCTPGLALDKPYNYFKTWTNSGEFADSNYFPIAVWLQAPSYATQYKAIGVNLFVGNSTLAEIATLKNYGMRGIFDQSTDARTLMNNNTYKATMLGWGHQDEPDNAQSNGSGGYEPCISTDSIVHLYNTKKSVDATRPIFLNLGRAVSDIGWYGRGTCTGNWQMYPGYIQGCDIVSYDIYPVNDGNSNLYMVPKGVDSLRSWCNNAKPVWVWIECTDISDGGGGKPTPAQVKSEIWMSLVHGANGYGFFCHSFLTTGGSSQAVLNDATMKDSIKAINARVASLAAVLHSATITGRVTKSSANVNCLVKDHNDRLFIFATAMSTSSASCTFTVTNPPATTVTVLDENRTITMTGNQFTDSFAGYGVHLYQIGGTPVIAVNDRKSAVLPAVEPLSVYCCPSPSRGTTGVFLSDAAYGVAFSIAIYAADGRLVRTLDRSLDQLVAAWDGKDHSGKQVPEGMYLVKVAGRNAAALTSLMVLE